MIPTKETITVIKSGTLDDWGRPTGTTQVTYKCRIDYKNQVITNSHGDEKVARATILIKGIADVAIEDTLTWTDSFGVQKATPLSVTPVKDILSKVIFTKVMI